ncbi:hypothetical protein EG327_001580, partial [Venturia inaequalis]
MYEYLVLQARILLFFLQAPTHLFTITPLVPHKTPDGDPNASAANNDVARHKYGYVPNIWIALAFLISDLSQGI